MKDASELLYGANAIGRFLGLTEHQVLYRAKQKHFPTFKMGRALCSWRADLTRWLAEHHEVPAQCVTSSGVTLRGTKAIAAYLGWPVGGQGERRVRHMIGRYGLPAFKECGAVCAAPEALAAWISEPSGNFNKSAIS